MTVQSAHMPRLVWAFAGHIPHCWKSHVIYSLKWFIIHHNFSILSVQSMRNNTFYAQLSMKFIILIKVKMPTIVCIVQIVFNCLIKVSKGAKIRNRYNQVPHLTQDTNGKVTNSQLDTTNESQEVNPFPAGGHKAHIYRRAQRQSKHKTEKS